MPLPKPEKDENKKSFIGRCITQLTDMDEFKDSSQRVAVCYSIWDRKDESFHTSKDVIKKIDYFIMEKN